MSLNFKNIYMRIAFIMLFLYSLLGFVVIPYLVQSNFSKILKKELNTNAYLSRVYLNPFTFTIELHNLLIQDKNNELLLYIESIQTDIEPTQFLFGEITLDYIEIDSLKTSISLYKDNKFNFSHIIEQLQQEQKETQPKTTDIDTKPLFFTLNSLYLKNTTLEFYDHTKSSKFEIKTKPFDFEVENFSTKHNTQALIKTNIQVIDTLNLNLNSNLIVVPTKLDGSVSIQKIHLAKIHEYLKDDLEFTFDGLIDNISTTYTIDLSNNKINTNLNNFNINASKINYDDKKFNITASDTNTTIKNTSITKGADLLFNLQDIEFKNQNIKFKDYSKKDSLNFSDLSIAMDKFTSNKKEPSQISLSLKTPKSGNVNLETKAIQEPLNIDSKLLIKDFTITPYKAYVKDFINIDIKRTSLDIDSKILLTKNKQNVKADVNISKIDLAHNITNKNLLKLNTINIQGLKYTNNNLFIKKVLLDDFSTSFKIDKNKNTSFDNLVINNEKETKPNPNKKKSVFTYHIKELVLSNGKAEFSDHSLPLNFDTNIHSLQSTIHDLSSKNTETNIEFQGVIEKYGVAKINAKTILTNFKNKTDVEVEFKNLDVISFSPYSGKFIGQKIADGRLWLDLNYQIRDAQLSSTNNIKIKNLTLGEDVDSKDALSLPVGLAIALLEDGEGLIDLDVPVKGNMQEPEFELSGVIWKTLGNVITNIVTAPFRFLGSLLGIDSDELGTITFDFAHSNLLPPEKEKLDKLIDVLQKKKNLVIVLQPTLHKTEDIKYLKDIKFNKMIGSKDRVSTIKKIYQKQFGTKKFKELKKTSVKTKFIDALSSQIKYNIIIPQNELDLLAKQRVINIKEYFLSHKLRLDRIQIKNNIFENEDTNAKELSLKLELNIKD